MNRSSPLQASVECGSNFRRRPRRQPAESEIGVVRACTEAHRQEPPFLPFPSPPFRCRATSERRAAGGIAKTCFRSRNAETLREKLLFGERNRRETGRERPARASASRRSIDPCFPASKTERNVAALRSPSVRYVQLKKLEACVLQLLSASSHIYSLEVCLVAVVTFSPSFHLSPVGLSLWRGEKHENPCFRRFGVFFGAFSG